MAQIYFKVAGIYTRPVARDDRSPIDEPVAVLDLIDERGSRLQELRISLGDLPDGIQEGDFLKLVKAE